jgi:hypothetical protein
LGARVRGQRGHDGFQNAIYIFKNIVVPEMQHAITVISQPSVAHSIAFVDRMLAAVEFDDQPLLATNEIDDIRSDRFLPDKFVAGN